MSNQITAPLLGKGLQGAKEYTDKQDAILDSYIDAVVNVGSKNILPNPLKNGLQGWKPNSDGSNYYGRMYKYEDGSISLETLSSGNTVPYVEDILYGYTGAFTIPAGKWILTDNQVKTGGDGNIPQISIRIYSDAALTTCIMDSDEYKYPREKEFATSGTYYGALYVDEKSNWGLNTKVTLWPMLRNADALDDTYVPYGMSNPDLTKTLIDVKDTVSKMKSVNSAYINEAGSFLTSNWLLGSEGGSVIIPQKNELYFVLSEGDYYNQFFKWNGTIYEFVSKVADSDDVTWIDANGDTVRVGTFEYTSYSNSNAGERWCNTILYVPEHSRHLKIYIHGGNNNAARNAQYQLYFGGNVVRNGDASSNWSATYETDLTTEDVGKTIRVRLYVGSSGSYSKGINLAADSYVEVVQDYKYDKANEYDLNITEQEISEIFEETYGANNPSNNVYSTEERAWGKWIDGKTIYRKVIDVGAIGKSGTKSVSYGTTIDMLINARVVFFGTETYGTSNSNLPTSVASDYGVFITNRLATGCNIQTGANMALSKAHLIIDYTKV